MRAWPHLLRSFALVVLAVMLGAITWASWQCPLFAIPAEVVRHPWFLTTLLDAYLAFFVFYLWVAWKEQSLGARAGWLVALMLWGNVAIAVYLLAESFRPRNGQSVAALLTARRPGHLALPGTLCVLALIVYAFSALRS